MKVGIILYSQTGNTLSVAERLKESISKNHNVTIERIEVEDKSIPRKNPYKLSILPNVDNYDILIFGSLVEAFSLSPVTKDYLKQINSLKNKKVLLYVTEHFPKPWMGGNHAIKQMKKIVLEKEGNIIDSGVINWKNKKREDMTNDLVNRFSNHLK
jgi:flavodoxin